MKKLFAIVMTLLLVVSLPLFAMAEEATAAPETSADTAVEEATTAPETSADTTVEEATTAPETAENTTEESTEPESETDPEIRFGFYPETALVTLPIMGMGMLGIFLVTCVIVLAVLVLSKLGGKNKEE